MQNDFPCTPYISIIVGSVGKQTHFTHPTNSVIKRAYFLDLSFGGTKPIGLLVGEFLGDIKSRNVWISPVMAWSCVANFCSTRCSSSLSFVLNLYVKAQARASVQRHAPHIRPFQLLL